jgi:acetyl esterase/lipase
MSSERILSKVPPVADVLVKYGDDDEQFADLRLTFQYSPSPLAVVIHGGFWREKYTLMHAGHLCVALTKAGISTLNVEYRRVGNPGGGWPNSLKDIEAAFQFTSAAAEDKRLDLNRVIVIGHSAGGQLALALASRYSSLRGIIALAPVSDLRRAYDLHLSNDAVVEFLLGTPAEIPSAYAEASPIEIPISIPQLVIHGAADETVPVGMSRSYTETKQKQGEHVRLLELDCGHFELIDPSSRVWPSVEQAALELLKP